MHIITKSLDYVSNIKVTMENVLRCMESILHVDYINDSVDEILNQQRHKVVIAESHTRLI